jgi:hypothetical protein
LAVTEISASDLSSATVEQVLSIIERLCACIELLTDAASTTMAEALAALAGAFNASQAERAMQIIEALVNRTGELEFGNAALSTATALTGEMAIA